MIVECKEVDRIVLRRWASVSLSRYHQSKKVEKTPQNGGHDHCSIYLMLVSIPLHLPINVSCLFVSQNQSMKRVRLFFMSTKLPR